MIVDFKTQDSKSAIAIAVGFHILILLLVFLFMNFTIPDPIPGTEATELTLADFGMDAEGQGDTETETPSAVVEEVVDNQISQTTQVESVVAQEVVTQEESVVQNNATSQEETAEPDPDPEISNALQGAFGNISSSGGGGGDGNSNTSGNQGVSNGHIDGKGVFNGGFVSMIGRGLLKGPDTSEKPTEEGTVAVKVNIDRNGNVTGVSIDAGHPSHTATSSYLFNLAKKQARTAKFTKNSGAKHTQQGHIVFRYKLK